MVMECIICTTNHNHRTVNVFKPLRVRLLPHLSENGKFCQNSLKSVHVLCTDGVSAASGWFKVAPALDTDTVEKFFQHKVLKNTPEKREDHGRSGGTHSVMVRHSGFNVYAGSRIQPRDEEAMEKLAGYTISAFFSPERMAYRSDEFKMIYRSKDGKSEQLFDTREWLAAMSSLVPNNRNIWS